MSPQLPRHFQILGDIALIYGENALAERNYRHLLRCPYYREIAKSRLELLKAQKPELPPEELPYFTGSNEYDFFVSEGDEVRWLVQVTWEMTDAETRKREFAGLLEAAKATGCGNLTIVTSDEDGEEVHEGLTIRIVPVCSFLLSDTTGR